MSKKEYTEDDHNLIVALIKAGKTRTEIATIVGRSYSSIAWYVIKHELGPVKKTKRQAANKPAKARKTLANCEVDVRPKKEWPEDLWYQDDPRAAKRDYHRVKARRVDVGSPSSMELNA